MSSTLGWQAHQLLELNKMYDDMKTKHETIQRYYDELRLTFRVEIDYDMSSRHPYQHWNFMRHHNVRFHLNGSFIFI